jgi:C4-dicarboxylate transporter/malic acid transport protein
VLKILRILDLAEYLLDMTKSTQAGFLDLVRHHVHGYTWSWFIWPMATLGLSLLISNLPYRFRGLTTIGIIIYLFGVVTFCGLLLLITIRFSLRRGSLRRSLQRPAETLFFSAVLLAFASVIGGAHQYGHPKEGSRLASTLRVVFWIYASFAYVSGLTLYMRIFTGTHLLIPNMSPAWMLPIFPVILTGTVASIVASTLEPQHSFPILICGLTFQGLGTLVSLLVSAIYLFRLFQIGLPDPDARPGMYLAVGPPSFTAVAIIKLAADIPPDYSYFKVHPGSEFVVQTMALFIGIFFWAFAFWFFSLATIACLTTIRKMSFRLTWYSFIFPNAGFTIATLDIGKALDCPGINWVGTGMTIILVVVWLVVMMFHARAVWKGTCLS